MVDADSLGLHGQYCTVSTQCHSYDHENRDLFHGTIDSHGKKCSIHV